jgi:hypothetical protein
MPIGAFESPDKWSDCVATRCFDLNGFRRKVSWRTPKGVRGYERGERVVVSIPYLDVKPFCGEPEIENYFRKLCDRLDKRKCTDVVFRGGGTIQLPEFFKEWSKKKGISVHFIVYEEDVGRLCEHLSPPSPPTTMNQSFVDPV